MRLVQLSDTHLLSDPCALLWDRNPTDNLTAMVESLPSVDVLIVSGDVSEDGSEKAYRRIDGLTERVAPRRYFIPGNHDDLGEMTAVFGEVSDTRLITLTDGWTLVLLNSQWTGQEAGRLADDTLSELRRDVEGVEGHALVVLHHPPISPCPSPDCGLLDGDLLIDALRGTSVRAVLSGHVHQHFEVRRDGITFVGAPSTLSQLAHGGEPHYTDTGEAPGALLVDLHDDGTIDHRVLTPKV